MLYVKIEFEEIPKYYELINYNDIVEEVIKQTQKYIIQGAPIYGIVLDKQIYDYLMVYSKKNSRFWSNVKCDKIETFYGFRVAIKE